jgi:hypothetical protein
MSLDKKAFIVHLENSPSSECNLGLPTKFCSHRVLAFGAATQATVMATTMPNLYPTQASCSCLERLPTKSPNPDHWGDTPRRHKVGILGQEYVQRCEGRSTPMSMESQVTHRWGPKAPTSTARSDP